MFKSKILIVFVLSALGIGLPVETFAGRFSFPSSKGASSGGWSSKQSSTVHPSSNMKPPSKWDRKIEKHGMVVKQADTKLKNKYETPLNTSKGSVKFLEEQSRKATGADKARLQKTLSTEKVRAAKLQKTYDSKKQAYAKKTITSQKKYYSAIGQKLRSGDPMKKDKRDFLENERNKAGRNIHSVIRR